MTTPRRRSWWEDVQDSLYDTFVTGIERTLHHDAAFGVRQLADIAIKARSPAINDPTTATQAVGRLGGILVLAGRRLPPARILTVDGRPTVFLPPSASRSWSTLPLPRSAAPVTSSSSPTCCSRCAASALVPPEHRAILVRHTRRARDEAHQLLAFPHEIDAIDTLATWLDTGDPTLPHADAGLFTTGHTSTEHIRHAVIE